MGQLIQFLQDVFFSILDHFGIAHNLAAIVGAVLIAIFLIDVFILKKMAELVIEKWFKKIDKIDKNDKGDKKMNSDNTVNNYAKQSPTIIGDNATVNYNANKNPKLNKCKKKGKKVVKQTANNNSGTVIQVGGNVKGDIHVGQN